MLTQAFKLDIDLYNIKYYIEFTPEAFHEAKGVVITYIDNFIEGGDNYDKNIIDNLGNDERDSFYRRIRGYYPIWYLINDNIETVLWRLFHLFNLLRSYELRGQVLVFRLIRYMFYYSKDVIDESLKDELRDYYENSINNYANPVYEPPPLRWLNNEPRIYSGFSENKEKWFNISNSIEIPHRPQFYKSSIQVVENGNERDAEIHDFRFSGLKPLPEWYEARRRKRIMPSDDNGKRKLN